LSRLATEHDNLRSALEWARDRHEDELLLRLAAALADLWRVRGLYVEARQWLTISLERATAPAEARMKVLRAASGRAVEDGDIARAEALVAEWRTMAEEAEAEDQLMSAMNAEARIAMEKGDTKGARAGYMTVKEVAAASGDRGMEAAMAVNLGVLATLSGDYRAGLDQSMEAAELFDDLHQEGGVATARINCGWNALGLGDPALAEGFFRHALLVAGRLGAMPRIATGAAGLAAALVTKQEELRGTELLGASESLREELQIGLNDEFEKRIEKEAVAAAKAALGEEAFAAAWARGEAMTAEEIVAFAKSEVETSSRTSS
jgi:non-specific serine/threonine protein kinase